MAAPYTPPPHTAEERAHLLENSPYVHEGPVNRDFQITRPKPETVFQDLIVIEMVELLDDSLRATWNGWESAVTLEDEDKQNYYMKLINILGETKRKLRKLK